MFDHTQTGYGPAHRELLWPPAWERQANAEGWTLRVAQGIVEVDYHPPQSGPGPIYRYLMSWLVLCAGLGSRMHLVAWTFEFAANEAIYRDGRVPGDGMHMVLQEDGSSTWVDDEEPFSAWPR